MKRIILVDLDDTLLSFKKASEVSLRKIFKMHNIRFTKENYLKYEEINQMYWEKYERKEIDRDLILKERFRDFLKDFNIETTGEKENEIYFRGLIEKVYFMPNAKEFLKKCQELNLTVCLVSNGVNKVQIPRLKKAGINKYLTKKYVSELVGYAKPSVEFFNKVFEDFPNQKEDMVIIGDSLTSDIQGGRNANITTVWFNIDNKENKFADYSISNLMDFFSLDIMK